MKRICIVMLVALFATGLASASSAKDAVKTAEKPAAASAETGATSNEFTQSKAWNKVGANLQQAYLAALATNFASDERLTCFVKANEQLMDGDQSFLTSNGFVVQMASGFTARGQMAMKNLPSVANLPFVQKIDTGK
jgi:hypothetical protein